MSYTKIEYPYSEQIIDTHAHYDDQRFDGFRDGLMEYLKDNGICAIINNAVDCFDSAEMCLEMSQKHPHCYCAIGVHPLNIEENGPLDIDLLKRLLKTEKVVAVGEIGLDYHYTPETAELQKQYFSDQLALANELLMPAIVHDRDAHADTYDILKRFRPKGTLHCFSGSVELARETVGLGMYIGVGGVVTFSNARKLIEVVEYTPIERLLLETDAPYLAPVPFRGQTNHSVMLTRVAERVAEIKKMSVEDVIKITSANAKGLYGI